MKRSLVKEISQVLFPDDVKCIVCGREIHPNKYSLCDDCGFTLNRNFCLRCGRHKVGIGDYCGECKDLLLHFDECRSAVDYEGEAKNVIMRLKYSGSAYLSSAVSEHMLDVLFATDWDFDRITFVPMHKDKRKKRGYNQAELLALEISERINVECSDLLEKTKVTKNQAALSGAERLENLKGAFSAKGEVPKHVLLIDDVFTTGATTSECAKVLKKAGAEVVYVLTFASVPERPSLDTKTRNISEFGKKNRIVNT